MTMLFASSLVFHHVHAFPFLGRFLDQVFVAALDKYLARPVVRPVVKHVLEQIL
jgi:hypothetical protein